MKLGAERVLYWSRVECRSMLLEFITAQKALFYRQEAARALGLADRALDAAAKLPYLELAADWDLLARQLESFIDKGGEPCCSSSHSPPPQ
jgi:hypothetical protein